MLLEFLPNEIFLDIFDYLDGNDLFNAFDGLNAQFNYLLYQLYRTFRLNLTSISKRRFDLVCQQYLPPITDRVIHLSLSNGDKTPHGLDLFISYLTSINRFTHLRSLSIAHFRQYSTLLEILNQCHEIVHLNYLKIDSRYWSDDPSHYQVILDQIWSLPKLIRFDTNCFMGLVADSCTSTKISSSIKRLSIAASATKLNQLNQIFKSTPYLQHLSIEVDDSANDYLPTLLPTLLNLNIVIYNCEISNILSCLQSMPNLSRLNLHLPSKVIDGTQWQEMISNYLPKLKVFKLTMKEFILLKSDIEVRMKNLIDSYRNSFWIDERQWFVRCFLWRNYLHLYTLPKTLSPCEFCLYENFLSTYPDDNLQWFCQSITTITDRKFSQSPMPSDIRLTNIRNLSIEFPINDQFWSIVPHLHRLHTLTIFVDADTSQSQLQTVFDRAPNLRSLNIAIKGSFFKQLEQIFKPWHLQLLQCTHGSLRHLDISRFQSCSSEEQCKILTHSTLLAQCETLYLQMKNYEHILSLLFHLNNLRVLTVYFKYNEDLPLSCTQETRHEILNRDQMIERLKERLSSNYLIDTGPDVSKTHIRIWK